MSEAEDRHLTHCGNCDEALQGPFCHRCGQRGTSLDVPLRQLVGEALGNIFALDSRLLRTLVPLIGRPGFLTEEYNAGRRAPYVSPVTLYFFFSFLMFLVLTLSGYSVIVNEGMPVSEPGEERRIVAIYRTETPDDRSTEDASSEDAGAENTGAEDAGGGELPWLLQRIDQLLELYEEDPRGFDATFRSHLARALIFLVPVFALLLGILYLRASPYSIRHLVMSLHLHAFAFLAISLGVTIDRLYGHDVGTSLMNLVLAVYLYVALRRVYGQGRLLTLVKLLVLAMAYLFVLAITIAATLLVTLSMSTGPTT